MRTVFFFYIAINKSALILLTINTRELFRQNQNGGFGRFFKSHIIMIYEIISTPWLVNLIS